MPAPNPFNRGTWSGLVNGIWICLVTTLATVSAQERAATPLAQLKVQQGIVVVLGSHDPNLPLQLAKSSQLTIYVQAADARTISRTRQLAHQAGLLGTRIYVERGQPQAIHLASNLADGAIVQDKQLAANKLVRAEVLRVLHPRAKAILGDQTITKPRPVGADDWSHPYHGPDNNPQSTDQQAKAPYLTQFLTDPWYVPDRKSVV
jgi:hypothetical protein